MKQTQLVSLLAAPALAAIMRDARLLWLPPSKPDPRETIEKPTHAEALMP
jgi:hypothetical protein